MGEMKLSHEPTAKAPEQFWRTYRVPIVLGGISLLLIAISLTILIKSFQTSIPIEFSRSSPPEVGSSGQASVGILVDVQGAVVSPGVYQLAQGARVEEAIAAAGGLTADSDSERIAKAINRAAKLTDGAKLYIPRKGSDPESSKGLIPIRSGDSGVSSVSVNTASQSELESLPGIGPVIAKKVIGNRPYGSLEELLTKKVLGQSLFQKLKDQLSL